MLGSSVKKWHAKVVKNDIESRLRVFKYSRAKLFQGATSIIIINIVPMIIIDVRRRHALLNIL